MNIKQILIKNINLLNQNNVDDSVIKAKLLLCSILKKEKDFLITHDDYKLSYLQKKMYNKGIKKIINNDPIQYIIGNQEFMGIKFSVNKNVLIPQPDTEILCEEIINKLEKNEKKNILDLCTGSGAIGISLKKYRDNVNVTASDISIKALKVARKNAIANNVDIVFLKSNLFNNIKEKFDIIVSNPPYIKSKSIKTLSGEVQKEPRIALDGGKDGLDMYKKIIKEAYKFLNSKGILALEIGYDQKEDVIDLLKQEGMYENIYSKKDLAGNDRIVVCNKI